MKPRLPIDPPPAPMAFADALASASAYLVLGPVVFNGVVAVLAALKGWL